MPNLVIEIAGSLGYTIIWIVVWRISVQAKEIPSYINVLLVFFIAMHGYISYLNIDIGNGHNFGLFNILNMTTWISMMIVLWNLFKYTSTCLLLFYLPISIVSIVAVGVFDGNAPVSLHGGKTQILHILLGITAMGILMLAAVQSILILYIDNTLRNAPSKLSPIFDSLQSLERYLYQLLISGFILMTISLMLATFFSSDTSQPQDLHKVILTISSWFVLAILILGHYVKGWRGVFAAKWTLIGVFLLLLGYFGSKLVQEFIIG